MEKDVSSKLKSVLNGIDKNTITKNKKNIEQLLSTPEGQKLASQLKNTDKSKLINLFMSLDSDELKHKLQNTDLSKLSELKPDDILKFLR